MTDATPFANHRRRLVEAGAVVADELVARHELPPSGDIVGAKLVVTFGGAFEFQVGSRRSWIDSGRLLFARDGEHYIDHHVVPGVGHASVILTPSEQTIDELWGEDDGARIGAGSLRIHRLAQLLRHADDPLAAQELAIALVADARETRRIDPIDLRCVRLAKAALHDCDEGRISLEALAADIGVTPVHLTQCFKRSEGMPLYRYQTMLRLARALERLPDSDDITDLALELGFSSHSHFTAAFRQKVGVTPSRFRDEVRGTKVATARA